MHETFETPLAFPLQKVLPEWTDYNGHMNTAYYMLAFDNCVDILLNRLQIGPDQLQQSQCSAFVLETHINYIREVFENEPLQLTAFLLDHNHKRFHYYLEMHHAKEGHLIATTEQLAIHVDMKQRKSCAMPQITQALLAAMASAHKGLANRKYIGRVVGISR